MEVLAGVHKIVKNSAGTLSKEQIAYISGALESVLVIFRTTVEVAEEDRGGIKSLFRG